MKGKATLILAGIALAGFATAASAAKPAMTGKEKQELAEKARKQVAADMARQPRNQAEARTTLKTERGVTTVLVPTDLWNTLAAEKNPDGTLRVVEFDGTGPTPKTEGLPNE